MKSVFCGTCGNELREGAKFCDECGAVVPQSITAEPAAPVVDQPIQPVLVVPPKPEKAKKVRKARKPFRIHPAAIAAVAIVLILAVTAAVVLPILFPVTETVYLLTSCVYTSPSGRVTSYNLEYDDHGNLIRREDFPQREDGAAFNFSLILNYAYDKHNNLTEYGYQDEPLREFDYRYDEDGRITEYTETYPTGSSVTCELSYDRKGNLILAEYDYDLTEGVSQPAWARWQSYEYDRQNRLTAEVFCDEYDYAGENYFRMYRCEYDYDKRGNVMQYRVLYCETDDPDDPDYEEAEVMTLSYDEEDHLAEVEYEIQGASRMMEVEYEYDRDGNLKPADGGTYTFDENGNLICIEYESGAKAEFTYEAFTVSRGEAKLLSRRKRWYPYLRSSTGTTYGLDPIRSEMRLPIGNLPAATRNHLYYCLIPNPIW